MKKMIMTIAVLVSASLSFAQSLTGFEDALKGASDYCAGRLPKGTVVAFTGWTADTESLSDYLVTELQQRFERNTGFVLVERGKVKALEKEIGYQYNGNVSDESAVSMAQQIGARTVVYGDMRRIGSFCRLTVSASDVEKNVIQATLAYNVRLDPFLMTLLDPHYQEKQDALEPYQGKDNRANITVTGNHKDNIYRDGDRLVITIRSDKDGYFKVSHVDVDGNMQTIYPYNDKIGKNNFIKAGETRIIPDNPKDPNNDYEMEEPYGAEYILVAVYDAQFSLDNVGAVPLSGESVSRGLKVKSEKGRGAVNLLGAAKYTYTILPK